MSIRSQAKQKGHDVNGVLKRIKDDVFELKGKEIRFIQYVDTDGTLYALNMNNELIYICGDDWVI